MAVANTASAFVDRVGMFLDKADSWTLTVWVRRGATTPSGGNYRTFWQDVHNTGSNEYLYLGSSVNANDLLVEVFDGTTYTDTAAVTVTASTWRFVAVTYHAPTTTLKFYVGGKLIDTLVIDLSAITFGISTQSFGQTYGDQAVAYMRVWQGRLSASELAAEALSVTAVRRFDLLADTPLTGLDDLFDQSGNSPAADWELISGTLVNVSGPFAPTYPTHYDFLAGWWSRSSAASSIAFSPYGYFHQTLVNGTVIVRIIFANIVFVSGTPPTSDFDVVFSYWNGTGFVSHTITNPYIDPFVIDYTSSFHYRQTDPGLAWTMAIRTSTYDPITNTLDNDGSLTVCLANVPILVLDAITFGVKAKPTEFVGMRHQMQGDFDRPWVMTGTSRPTVDGAGVLSFTTGLVYQDDFNGGDRSAWADWAGQGANTPPYMLADCGAANTYGASSFSTNPAVFGVVTFLGYAGLQRDITLAAVVDLPPVPNPCTPTLDLPNPCDITTPELWMAIQVRDPDSGDPGTKTVYLAGEVNKALNDPSDPGTYGARKRPDVVDFGTTKRASSDPITGQLPAQTHALRLNDAQHFWRAARKLHAGDFTNAQMWVYLTDGDVRRAGGRPFLMMRGFVDNSALTENLGDTLSMVDQVGNAYKLHSPEPTLPQRTIRGANFPGDVRGGPVFLNWTDPDLRNPRRVPFTVGSYRDTDNVTPGYIVGGVVPAICLNEYVMADASTWVLGLISGHDHKGGIEQLFQPESATESGSPGTTDPGLIPDNDPDAKWPGQVTAGWATINPSGAALYTDLDGERFTLFAVKGDRATAFRDGSKPIYANVRGPTTTADGLGDEFTKAFSEIERWVWYNWILRTPGYLTGDYYTSAPSFDFYPGTTDPDEQFCTFDDASFDTTQTVSELYLIGGFTFGGLVGANGDGEGVRDVIANLNRSGMAFTTWNRHGQIKKFMLDRTRDTFLGDKITLDPYRKRGIVRDPNFTETERRDWLVDNLRVTYAYHARFNRMLGDLQEGRGEPFLKYGSLPKEVALPYTITTEQAQAILTQMLDVYSVLPKISQYARTWCGLEDDLGDGRAITHFNGNGGEGYVDECHLILEQDYVYTKGQVVNRALDVEHAMYHDEAPATGTLLGLRIEGTEPGVGFSQQFHAFAVYSDKTEKDVTKIAAWSSSNAGVATVGAATGYVTGIAAGSVVLTATYQLVATASRSINIVTVTLASVVVSGVAPSVGGTRQLTATAVYSDGSEIDVTTAAAWASSDAGVFTVGAATGVATGVAEGTADASAVYP